MNQLLKLKVFVAIAAVSSANYLYSQGCVISRGGAGHCDLGRGSSHLQAGDWRINTSYRWLYSDRHFSGTEEHTHRQEEHTEVINNSHFLDVTMTYAKTRQLMFNFTVPTVYSDRSSLYEHKGNNSGERYSTHASGIGDLRLTASYWMKDPETHPKTNLLLGFGFKAPTGDYKATDVFQRRNGPMERFVDSSIQPGDGGWGLLFDAQAYHMFSHRTIGYAAASYLANPKEDIDATGFSVPDSFLYRAGVEYAAFPSKGINLSIGGRMEGVQVEDLWGGSNGRRRPGYTIAIEPGFTYSDQKRSIAVTVPIALIRNRTQSIPEIPRGRHGDAAFADYTVNISYSYRF